MVRGKDVLRVGIEILEARDLDRYSAGNKPGLRSPQRERIKPDAPVNDPQEQQRRCRDEQKHDAGDEPAPAVTQLAEKTRPFKRLDREYQLLVIDNGGRGFWHFAIIFVMTLRGFLTTVGLTLLLITNGLADGEFQYYKLPAEPFIRIGLETNAGAVTITTTDSSLVAVSPDEPLKMLATTRVTVSARAYRPPEIENFRIEFQNLPTQNDANQLAKDIRAATSETALPSIDPGTNTWKVWVGIVKETSIDADALKAKLAEKGFDDAVVVSEKKTIVTPEAAALSQQLRSAGGSDVRSLVRNTGSSNVTVTGTVDPNLREVIIEGPSTEAHYSSLNTVAFGSVNERLNPVRLNGKAYRGKIEVFVNARGRLTVVNVVPLEDYLLGVVPSELGLPAIEAQKAQAVAARTYAIANIGGYGKQGFDMVPTVWSQVYKGVSIETTMGTLAVNSTRGIIATYKGQPINALYTSTCGGRTEDVENIFDKPEPYLRGVECSLEGHRHFEPFLIKTARIPAKVRDEGNLA